MFGGKKAKELEEELLALQEKQNRLQEQISNIAKAKDSAEETLVQMTISKRNWMRQSRRFQRNWNC